MIKPKYELEGEELRSQKSKNTINGGRLSMASSRGGQSPMVGEREKYGVKS